MSARSKAGARASLGIVATIGIVFGFYLAWKVSRPDPIESLRYE